ncbi:MAG: acyl carrier protein [Ruminococcaceae bacterium]|nr:acyl carrier protein [Oscillospiraceae bacterium]
MLETVKEIICDYVETDIDEITAESSLRYDIGATSFDLMNIAVEIEERFGLSVPDNALHRIKTVGDIAELLEKATA